MTGVNRHVTGHHTQPTLMVPLTWHDLTEGEGMTPRVQIQVVPYSGWNTQVFLGALHEGASSLGYNLSGVSP